MTVQLTKEQKKSMKELAEKQVLRLKEGHPKDIKGFTYNWDEGKKCFTRVDEHGKLWLKGINTTVPAYWSYCPNEGEVDRDGLPTICNTPHFVFIYEDGDEKICDECKKPYKINIVLPKEK